MDPELLKPDVVPEPVVPEVELATRPPVDPEELDAAEDAEVGPEVVLEVPPAVPWHARSERQPTKRGHARIWRFIESHFPAADAALVDCADAPNPSGNRSPRPSDPRQLVGTFELRGSRDPSGLSASRRINQFGACRFSRITT